MRSVIDQRLMMIVFLILIFSANAWGQEKAFPINPINFYLGWTPGGGGASAAITITEGMKKYLKQPMIVNYKPGAAQVIAAEFVKNSKPDGYTLLLLSPHDLMCKLGLEGSRLKFRLEDLDSLGAAANSPYCLAVNAKSPWKTISDLIAEARKSPGNLAYASSSAGALTHLSGVLFSKKAGVVLNHVPFESGGPANTALLGNHVQMAFQSVASFGSHILPGGGMRALVVFDRERDVFIPDVPTAVESGIDMSVGSWYALLGPKRLQKEVRSTLIEAYEKTAKDPEIISQMKKLSLISFYLNPAQTDKRMREEYDLFKDVWEKAGLAQK